MPELTLDQYQELAGRTAGAGREGQHRQTIAALGLAGEAGEFANLIKKMVGLSIFQTSVFIFYISMAKVEGGTAPILAEGIEQYSNPLPHVLILIAIVVGIATTALGLALVVRIKEAYGSIEEERIQKKDNSD